MNKILDTAWPQEQRLKFIERQLLWERNLTTTMICEVFGVSRAQATKDIKRYIDIASKNVKPYNPADRCYKPTLQFVPQLIDDSKESLVTVDSFYRPNSTTLTTVPLLTRRCISGVLSVLMAAIEHKLSIEAIYASMNHPLGIKRILSPQSIICADNRLHVRAYCWVSGEYRDFVLSRFQTLPKIGQQNRQPPVLDYNWIEMLNISLVVNPSLNIDQQRLIARDFGFNNTSLEIQVRKALIPYFLQMNLLPCTQEDLEHARIRPERYPLLPQIEITTVQETEALNDLFFDKK